jgi:hypothetical protein
MVLSKMETGERERKRKKKETSTPTTIADVMNGLGV